jgi:hypothetical protein
MLAATIRLATTMKVRIGNVFFIVDDIFDLTGPNYARKNANLDQGEEAFGVEGAGTGGSGCLSRLAGTIAPPIKAEGKM